MGWFCAFIFFFLIFSECEKRAYAKLVNFLVYLFYLYDFRFQTKSKYVHIFHCNHYDGTHTCHQQQRDSFIFMIITSSSFLYVQFNGSDRNSIGKMHNKNELKKKMYRFALIDEIHIAILVCRTIRTGIEIHTMQTKTSHRTSPVERVNATNI